jgi:hypothetical protein
LKEAESGIPLSIKELEEENPQMDFMHDALSDG